MEARARQKKPIVVEAFSSIDGLGVGQAGTRLRQQRPHPSAGGVLRAWIRPATEPTGQVLGDLPGDLGADRGGGGVIEIGAHTPSLDGGSEEPDCPLGTTLKPLFVCGAGP